MSKSVVPLASFGKLPAHLQKRSQAATEAANKYITSVGQSGPRISLRGRRFRLRLPEKDAEQVLPEGTELNVVMMGASPEHGVGKVFYMGDYEPDSTAPPDCSSADGVKPDAWIQDPQNPDCATCPNNAWGSGKRGKGKACRDVKRIYVVPAQNVLDKDIFQIQVPPASLKRLSNYVRELAKHGVAPQYVATTIYFEDAEYPIINFKFAGFLDEEQVKIVEERIAKGDVQAAMERGATAPAEGDAPEVEQAQEEEEEEAPQAAPAPNWSGGSAQSRNTTARSNKAASRRRQPEPMPATEPEEDGPAAKTVDDPELDEILGEWGGGKK